MATDAADLASIPLFASLEEVDLRRLAGWFEERNADAGVRLIGEGAAGYCFFVLAEGTAEVTSDEATLGTLGPGDFFGEMAILGGGRRTASVTATSRVRLFVMYGTEFRRLQRAWPEVAGVIEAAMERRSGADSRA